MKAKYNIKRTLEFYRQCNEFFNIDDGLYPTSTSEEIMDAVTDYILSVDSDRILTESHIWELGKLLRKRAQWDNEIIANDVLGGVDFSESLDMLDSLSN